jgi:hypothetical protein
MMLDNIEEKQRFATLMLGLSDYYKQELSKTAIKLYWEGLKQYDYEAIEKAAWAHTQSPDEAGRWMPKISDLAKVLQGRTVDQASSAWSKVDKAVRQVGTYADVAFDDAVIHRVIQDMGGWIRFGEKTDDEWPFVANEFMNRYRGFKMRDEVPEYPGKLIGIAGAQNASEGIKFNPGVRLIGDAQKAVMVIQGGLEQLGIGLKQAQYFLENESCPTKSPVE